MEWLWPALSIVLPAIWYVIGHHDGHAKGYARGRADKRKEIVDGMDNLLAADLIRVQIRRDAVVAPDGEEPSIKVDGIGIYGPAETKH